MGFATVGLGVIPLWLLEVFARSLDGGGGMGGGSGLAGDFSIDRFAAGFSVGLAAIFVPGRASGFAVVVAGGCVGDRFADGGVSLVSGLRTGLRLGLGAVLAASLTGFGAAGFCAVLVTGFAVGFCARRFGEVGMGRAGRFGTAGVGLVGGAGAAAEGRLGRVVGRVLDLCRGCEDWAGLTRDRFGTGLVGFLPALMREVQRLARHCL